MPSPKHDHYPQQPLIDLVKTLRSVARAGYQRRLVVLAGSETWCHRMAQGLVLELSVQGPLWVGRSAPKQIPSLTPSRASTLLGTETELLVYDASSGFDADAFGALSGTLVGGGLLFLLTPDLSEWPHYADPEHARIAVAGIPASAVTGRFLARLVRLIREDPTVIRLEQNGEIPAAPPLPLVKQQVESPDPVCRTPDQSAAVQAIMHVVTGHRRRPVVLLSDRGRGKSSALGIAAARLLKAGRQRILVTAPTLQATVALFEQAAKLLPGAVATQSSLHLHQAGIEFHAPDHLLQHPTTADLLLVDEAAAIPTPLLEALLEHYPRIAFATTVHGYEGTGRGFALRFLKVLDRRFPQWQEFRLETPIRWAPGDPLEHWLCNALVLNASPAPDALIGDTPIDQCRCEVLDRELLAGDEGDLGDLFGLLVLAHYRTTPFDLRHLLDGPNLRVLVLRARGRIVATALLATEGGLDPTTAQAVWAGYRRPRGHLLAQSIAAHIGIAEGARLRAARIIRIAVHPTLQQRGLGSLLVTEVMHLCRSDGLDYLGASFGATTELLRFWHKNGFQPLRIGLRRGASSGAQSVIVLSPITSAGTRICEIARQRFRQQLPRLLAEPLQRLEARLAIQLLSNAPPASLMLDNHDWLDLIGFAFARRGYENCLVPIENLVLRALGDDPLDPTQADLLMMKVIQQRDWAECARAFDLSGRAAVELRLRQSVGDLILRYADAATRELAFKIQALTPE